jgi:hypothetical protein
MGREMVPSANDALYAFADATLLDHDASRLADRSTDSRLAVPISLPAGRLYTPLTINLSQIGRLERSLISDFHHIIAPSKRHESPQITVCELEHWRIVKGGRGRGCRMFESPELVPKECQPLRDSGAPGASIPVLSELDAFPENICPRSLDSGRIFAFDLVFFGKGRIWNRLCLVHELFVVSWERYCFCHAWKSVGG